MFFPGNFTSINEVIMKYRFWVPLIMGILTLSRPVISGDAGTNGLSYLKLPVDGRSAGMGGVGVALSTDASAVFFNPAGLAATDGNQILFTHHAGILDIVQEFAAVRFSSNAHHLAFSVNVFSVPGIEIRGEDPTADPDGTSSALNFYASMAYARTVYENWQVGINVKYLYEKLYLHSASGWAVDLGIRRSNLLKNLDWGIALRNLGSMSKLKNETTPLPLILTTGLVYHVPVRFKPLLVADYEYINDESSALRLGMELPLIPALAIRLGTHIHSENVNWTTGFGFHFHDIEIQYGFVSDTFQLGSAHRFTVAYDF